MELLREIWFGVLQLGSFSGGSLTFIILDVIATAVLCYVGIQLLNTQKGWRYIGLLVGTFLLLIVSSLVALPGLHLLAQGAIIVMAVALPVIFRADWQAKLDPASAQSVQSATKYAAQGTMMITAIAFALLFVGVSTGLTTRTGQFPDGVKLSAVNVPEGLSASFGSVQKVNVLISGPREQWRSLTADSFSAVVDLGEQKEGTYTLAVHVTSKADGVTVVKTDPAQVVVTVEPVIKKTVPIVASFTGKASNDLVPDQPDITPVNADITGPKSVINDITQVVAPVKLDNQTATIDETVDLQVQTPEGDLITTVTIEPTQAHVNVPLVKSGKLKTVSIIAALSGQPKNGYWIQTVAITPPVVTVTGPIDQLQALTQVPTATFSVDGVSATKTQQLTLNPPSGISVADSTQSVSVTITVSQTSTTKSITPQLVYANLAGNLQVTATSPTSIAAIISGLSGALGSLSDGDVKINLDLSAYKSAGTYTIGISNDAFSIPNAFSLVSFLPSAISVTLGNK